MCATLVWCKVRSAFITYAYRPDSGSENQLTHGLHLMTCHQICVLCHTHSNSAYYRWLLLTDASGIHLHTSPKSHFTPPHVQRKLPAPHAAAQCLYRRSHGYYYYTRTEEDQQYRIHCRRAVPSAAGPPSEVEAMDLSVSEEVLLDENARKARGNFDFYMLGDAEESPNQKLLAWSEDTVGGEKFTLHVKVGGWGWGVGVGGGAWWAVSAARLCKVRWCFML